MLWFRGVNRTLPVPSFNSEVAASIPGVVQRPSRSVSRRSSLRAGESSRVLAATRNVRRPEDAPADQVSRDS